MSWYEIFIIAVALSMDAFAVSVCKGLSLGRIKAGHMVKAGVWFGGFQGLMPLIGFLLAGLFAGFIDQFDHWIAFILLVLIGLNMIREVFGKEEKVSDKMDVKTMLVMAVATSVDALAVGVSFAFLNVNIIPAILMIGVTTFFFSMVGVKLGSVVGTKYEKGAQLTGGAILVLLGIKILLEGLQIL